METPVKQQNSGIDMGTSNQLKRDIVLGTSNESKSGNITKQEPVLQKIHILPCLQEKKKGATLGKQVNSSIERENYPGYYNKNEKSMIKI